MKRILSLTLIPGFLALSGCAATGTLMQVAGGLSGQKGLVSAGSSMKRVEEVEDFSEEEKGYTGRTVAANLLAGMDLSDDEALEKYVGQVGQTVAKASGLEPVDGWHFVLLKGESADAFAAPGGIILVTEGLVKLCKEEDELAGVLAHEVAHVSLDHPMQAIGQANRKNALVGLASAAYGIAAKDNAQLGALTKQFDSVVKDVGKALAQGYDRDKEKEADLAAVAILADLGYDPRGLMRVLERVGKGGHSHGDPKDRAEEVNTAAGELGKGYNVLKARTERFKKAVKAE